jgi:protein-disulfide isomerase
MYKSSSTPHNTIRNLLKPHSLRVISIVFLGAFIVTLSSTVKGQDSQTIVAKVGEQTITEQEIDEIASGQIYSLQQQLFALRKATLTNLITKKILEREASRQTLSVDELKNKWMSGPVVVDQAQVNELYLKNRSAFGLMSADEAKEKLRLDLESQVRLKRYRDEIARLRQGTRVDVLLQEPRLVVSRNTNSAAVKGPANARVVITEFSDFQCPYCKEVQANLGRVMQAYADQVRLEFKSLPIEMHPFAFTAAKASYCGGKQGAFWEVHDALFAAAEPSLSIIGEIVRDLKLNSDQFDKCLSSTESQDAVLTDLAEARRLGIEGTPTFIINGKPLRGAASFEEFSELIERELKNAQIKSSTSQN